MKRKIWLAMALALLIVWPLGSAMAYEATTGPTGLLRYDKAKAYNGYTLYSPMIGSTTAYLIDMEGFIVHQWQTKYGPGLHDVLLNNGNILRGGSVDKSKTGCPISFGGTSGIVQEIDWNGNVVWEYLSSSPTISQHHTFHRMPNGNTLILNWEYHSKEEAVAKGRDPNTIYGNDDLAKYPGIGKGRVGIWPDQIEEVNPQGKVVWTWRVWDHLGTGPDQFNINQRLPMALDPDGFMNYMACADWTHFNTVGYLPENDVVIANSRNFGEWYLIDHKTGKLLYRWGNSSAYGVGKGPTWLDDGVQKLFGPHCALPIDSDCPGYYPGRSIYPANILIFDNGWQRPVRSRSRIVEVNPNINAEDPKSLVWSFETNCYTSFYTEYQGAVQRLPNGNTYITSTGEGHFIEVTPQKEIVWEFVNPVFMGAANCTFLDEKQMSGSGFNMVHRSHRYSPDHPGLKGRDLSNRWPFVASCPGGPAFKGTWVDPSTYTGFGGGTVGTGGAGGGGGAGGAGGGGGGGGY